MSEEVRKVVERLKDADALSVIRNACLAVASADTCCHPKEYARKQKRGNLPSPLWGHCAAVSHVVRACFGGDFMLGEVKKVRHFWNKLPDGREVDLTSCQFGGDGFATLVKGKPVPVYMIEPVPFAFLWFTHLVSKHMSRRPTIAAALAEKGGGE